MCNLKLPMLLYLDLQIGQTCSVFLDFSGLEEGVRPAGVAEKKTGSFLTRPHKAKLNSMTINIMIKQIKDVEKFWKTRLFSFRLSERTQKTLV